MSSWADTKKILQNEINFSRKTILDIGCGSGWFSMWSYNQGSYRVHAIDPQSSQIKIAKSNSISKNIKFEVGRAENLKFEVDKFDIVFFFNSLHHVPKEFMYKSIEEAKRVCKDGGILYVIEPVADGSFNQILKIIDDEKEIRFQAYETIKDFCKKNLLLNNELYYKETKKFKDFSEFYTMITSANEKRKKIMENNIDEVKFNFNSLSKYINNRYIFIQPMRMNKILL